MRGQSTSWVALLTGLRGGFIRHKGLLVVALAALVSFFNRAWEGDLHGDPVHYASVSKNMLTTGDWLTPQDAPGVLYASKPPLMFWLVAASFRVLGADIFAARLWSCLFAVGTSLVTYALGRRLFGPTAGMLAGCLVAATPGMVANAQDLRLDSAVALAAVTAVYAVIRADADHRPSWLLLAGVAGGLGAMTKAAAGVQVATLLLILLAVRRPRWFVHPGFLGALVLAAAIAVPWHAAMAVRHGSSFTATYFGSEMGARMALGGHVVANAARNVAGLLVYTMPWWPLAGYAAVRWRRGGAVERRGVLVAALWIAEVVALSSIPPKRYDRYLIPAYPAVALLAGCGINWLLSARLREAAPKALAAVALAYAVVSATLPTPLHSYRCNGFVETRPMLDHVAPGPIIAAYSPFVPEGQAPGQPKWGLRSKAIWYLDRDVFCYHSIEELEQKRERFVIVREQAREQLAQAGYQAMAALDENYWLFYRPFPSPP